MERSSYLYEPRPERNAELREDFYPKLSDYEIATRLSKLAVAELVGHNQDGRALSHSFVVHRSDLGRDVCPGEAIDGVGSAGQVIWNRADPAQGFIQDPGYLG